MVINMKMMNVVMILATFEKRGKTGPERSCHLPTVTQLRGRGRDCIVVSAAWDPGISSLRHCGDTFQKGTGQRLPLTSKYRTKPGPLIMIGTCYINV